MVFSRPLRYFNVGVHYLDDNKSYFQMKTKSIGREFFDSICQLLGLEEKDYFGLQFVDRHGNLAWLDNEKNLRKQIWHLKNRELLFRVKFYVPDPSSLSNEYTRYLFSLQIAIDLKGGFISGSDSDVAEMLSYILQADLGDFDQQNVDNIDLSRSLLSCNEQIVEQCFHFYKSNQGMLKSEADVKLLDKARRLPSYGKRFFSCQSSAVSNKPLCICTDCGGISIFEDDKQVATYPWGSIRNVVFRRRNLVVFCESEKVQFVFDNYHKCRSYWKIAVENFSFYKDVVHEKKRVGRSSLLKRGSRFRYSGKTFSAMKTVENHEQCHFERSHSSRISMHHPPRTPFIKTPSKEADTLALTPAEGLDWSAPLISEQELRQVMDVMDSSRPLIKRHLPLADPSPDLSYKRSFYQSTALIPNGDNPRLNRLASRGSIWSKRRIIRTNHREIPRIYEIATELYSSEKVYSRELAAITGDFKQHIEDHLTEDQLDLVATQFVPLMEQQSLLLPQLSQNLENINEESHLNCVLHFFTTVFDKVEIYEKYLTCLPQLMKIFLGLLSDNPELAQSCLQLEQSLYMPLTRLLLRPTQQLFYYKLLLDGICATSMSDENHSHFHEFYLRLGDLLSDHDAHIQDAVEMVYLYELSTHVVNSHCFTGRKLIRMGMLSVHSSQKLCFLFADLIVFCEPVSGTDLFSISDMISLHSLKNVYSENDCSFVLVQEGSQIQLETRGLEDKDCWHTDICKALSNLLEPGEEPTLRPLSAYQPHFPQNLFSLMWKYEMNSVTSGDLYNYFKITFSGLVHKKTRLSKQQFFVLLNNMCLYFFTDYSSKDRTLPECKHKLSLACAQIAMHTLQEAAEEEKYQFSLKIGERTTVLCSDSRYYQNRWAVSLESASV